MSDKLVESMLKASGRLQHVHPSPTPGDKSYIYLQALANSLQPQKTDGILGGITKKGRLRKIERKKLSKLT